MTRELKSRYLIIFLLCNFPLLTLLLNYVSISRHSFPAIFVALPHREERKDFAKQEDWMICCFLVMSWEAPFLSGHNVERHSSHSRPPERSETRHTETCTWILRIGKKETSKKIQPCIGNCSPDIAVQTSEEESWKYMSAWHGTQMLLIFFSWTWRLGREGHLIPLRFFKREGGEGRTLCLLCHPLWWNFSTFGFPKALKCIQSTKQSLERMPSLWDVHFKTSKT